ncbi:hypothetical protein [Leptolyngbya sp. AN10]|uniref:hypothetical protein n=1 Tax=Leptolyngbya sp. AN10 TaxID=3423365 RepID=UPI003D322565
MSLCIGCNQTVQSKAIPAATETPKTAPEKTVPAATEAPKTAPGPVATHTPSESAQNSSTEIETPTILEGRYWIGHTGQALEVEGNRYRYEDEGGTQPWRSITELQAVQEGVIYDGNNYWCLSSMAPQGQIASCSEKGWISPSDPEDNPSD